MPMHISKYIFNKFEGLKQVFEQGSPLMFEEDFNKDLLFYLCVPNDLFCRGYQSAVRGT